MIVVDASIVVDMVVPVDPDPALHERLASAELHAPHLIDVEVAHALRRHVLVGELSADRAGDALADAADLPIIRYPHLALVERAWELRDNVGVYDGVYLALAEILGMPLVTCDPRLANVPGHTATVEVFAPPPP